MWMFCVWLTNNILRPLNFFKCSLVTVSVCVGLGFPHQVVSLCKTSFWAYWRSSFVLDLCEVVSQMQYCQTVCLPVSAEHKYKQYTSSSLFSGFLKCFMNWNVSILYNITETSKLGIFCWLNLAKLNWLTLALLRLLLLLTPLWELHIGECC